MKQAELNRLNDAGVWDYRIVTTGPTLRLQGSNDFCYYHNVEVDFHGVTFCDLPEEFSHPLFRLGNSKHGKHVVLVEAEAAMEPFDRVYAIHASSVEIRFETVRYSGEKSESQSGP
jgi:hypothetical protein